MASSSSSSSSTTTTTLHHAWNSPPPLLRGPDHNYPTIIFSWWCTCFAVCIIGARLVGRKMRSNKLFREDWIMMAALVPLLARQALIHVVLLYRTNNVQTVGVPLSELDVPHRITGSRLVLAARIFYALFIWISKLTVSEFLKRITVGSTWRRSYQLTLQAIRVFLVISFGIVVVATLTECQPFDHFWQVVPDPGPRCRTGYANLISMGACDILTDILLIAFPIPIVLRSGQTWKRKLQLASLFSLSATMIAVTATRVPEVIAHRGLQQYRTVWASCEILASAAVSNAVILASFLRDKGVRRNRYRSQSVADSIERASTRRQPPHPGMHDDASDVDLFRSMGMRIPAHLQDKPAASAPRLAPAAPPPARHGFTGQEEEEEEEDEDEDEAESDDTDDLHRAEASDSDISLRKTLGRIGRSPSPVPTTMPQPPATTNGISLLDVGGLLQGDEGGGRRSRTLSPSTHSGFSGIVTHDFAHHARRGSSAMLQDVGGLLGPSGAGEVTPPKSGHKYHLHLHHHHHHQHHDDRNSSSTRLQSDSQTEFSTHARQNHHSRPSSPPPPPPPHPTGVPAPLLTRHDTEYSLQDAGGLLLIDMRRSRAAARTSHPATRTVGGGDDTTTTAANTSIASPQPSARPASLLRPSRLPQTDPDDDALPHIGILPPASPCGCDCDGDGDGNGEGDNGRQTEWNGEKTDDLGEKPLDLEKT